MRFAVPALGELILHQVVEYTSQRGRLGFVGARVFIPPDVSFRFAENIELGADVRLGVGNRLWASPNARITFGEYAMLGPDVTVLTANHSYDVRDVSVFDQPERERDVRIGADVWIGANAVILPGVTIGDGAVIAAGAVVNADVEPFTVAGGVPARRIGARGSTE